MKNFEGKLIYITGGSSGIGLEMGKIFAQKGANLLLIARNEQKLQEARQVMDKSRRSTAQIIGTLSVDVADIADVEKKMKIALTDIRRTRYPRMQRGHQQVCRPLREHHP